MSAKRQSFLVWEMPLTEFPQMSSADIRGYSVGQYHAPTDIEKYSYFSLDKTRIFETAADMYTFIME